MFKTWYLKIRCLINISHFMEGTSSPTLLLKPFTCSAPFQALSMALSRGLPLMTSSLSLHLQTARQSSTSTETLECCIKEQIPSPAAQGKAQRVPEELCVALRPLSCTLTSLSGGLCEVQGYSPSSEDL